MQDESESEGVEVEVEVEVGEQAEKENRASSTVKGISGCKISM
jgi:hypothetical protein